MKKAPAVVERDGRLVRKLELRGGDGRLHGDEDIELQPNPALPHRRRSHLSAAY
jgi:hypothetical protein